LTPVVAYASFWPVSVPDRDASRRLEALAREHSPALTAFAIRLCGDANEAHDLVQDTFERALRASSGQQPRSNERAWLFTILHHLFIDRYRRQARGPRHTSIDEIDVAAAEPAPAPAWASVSVEEVKAALEELDPDFREVYRMHAIDGLGYAEIAARLGAPMSTVGTRIMRARRKLRALLMKLAPEGDA
jgi:RNA polymerase sigma-70 factor (ECF subfamily)